MNVAPSSSRKRSILQELQKAFRDHGGPPMKDVPDAEITLMINSLLAWMFLVVAYIPVIYLLAVIIRGKGVSRFMYYGITLSMLIVLMLWRCIGNHWGGSFASCAVAIGMPGIALIIFGLGTDVLINAARPGVGSIRDLPLMIQKRPCPMTFFFTDGFVARNLTVTGRTCWKHGGNRTGTIDWSVRAGQCYHYSMAPVFATEDESLPDENGTWKGVVRAWAIPNHGGTLTFQGTADTIPADICEEGGLCGIQETAEVKQHAWKKERHLVQKFHKKYSKVSFKKGLPFICFVNPGDVKVLLKLCWVGGGFMVILSLLVTWMETKMLCEEVRDVRAWWLTRDGHHLLSKYDRVGSALDFGSDIGSDVDGERYG